jgi:ABC-type transport system involved in multi-copper enzyme maturation permease subunit
MANAVAEMRALPSRRRAWGYLVWLSFQRQGRARLLVWIALGLLVFLTFVIALNTRAGRWSMSYWRYPFRTGWSYAAWALYLEHAPPEAFRTERADVLILRPHRSSDSWQELARNGIVVQNLAADPVQLAVGGACRAVLDRSGFFVFSNWIVFSVFTSFLLPLWSLSFATEALGREREARNLLWLLSRPLSRPAIYLAKFVALLPWALALNLGGFALLCLAAGAPGRQAFAVYWSAVLWSTLAFCALFHLLGALFHRAAVIGLLYAFFVETVVNILPGHLKRVSISYYTRCLMYEHAHALGVRPERPTIYQPVSGDTALWVLVGAVVVLLLVGMLLFSRKEYLDLG